ncbi:MAG: hypothetical protein ACD_75C00729G0001, partial [uncultured bacterium]
GLAVGTEFVVYKEGEIIKHPKTGEVLDVEKIQTGQIRITKVDSNVAIGDILSEVGEGIRYGQMVKSVQASEVKAGHRPPPVAGPSAAPAYFRKEQNDYNLLRNGDFEAGLGFWGKGQYGDKGVWWNSGNCRSNVFAQKGSGRDGNAALYISNPTPRGPNVFGTTVQQLAIQPGKEYYITLFAKGKGLASGGAINISVDPAWKIRPIHLPANG